MNLPSRFSQPITEKFDAVKDLIQAIDHNLCILDTETTGFPRTAEVVELAYFWMGLDGENEAFSCLLNPKCNIPVDASNVHGIYDHHVKDAPTYDFVAGAVEFIFDNSVLSGYNVKNYDVDVLINNNLRFQSEIAKPDILDVREIWCKIHKTRKGKLTEVAEFYGVEPGEAHQGMGDVISTVRILEAMVHKHGVDAILPYLHINRTDRPGMKDAKSKAQQTALFG